jgi:hypothetical protein
MSPLNLHLYVPIQKTLKTKYKDALGITHGFVWVSATIMILILVQERGKGQ